MTLYTAEKGLTDAGDKVPADVKTLVEDRIKDLREVKDGADIEKIKLATQELSQNMGKIGEAMAQASKADEDAKPSEDSDIKDAEPGDAPSEEPKSE